MSTELKYGSGCFHDVRGYKPEEVNHMLDLLYKLPASLQLIIQAELKAGNKIEDVSEGYPDKGSICVGFFKRFGRHHETGDVTYNLTNDPHYWYADYATTGSPRHLLVCNW